MSQESSPDDKNKLYALRVDAGNPGKDIIHCGKFKRLPPPRKGWLRWRRKPWSRPSDI